jgi:hypothetical protein
LIAAIASAALLVVASLAVGQAVLMLSGRREGTWLAGPVGLAVLLVVSGIIAGWGGTGAALAIAFVVMLVASAVALGWAGLRHGFDLPGLGAGLLAALAAAIPFIAAGHVGILGVGLVNDDMASHLLLADWIDERFRPEPVLVDQGYPLGPHALVAGLSDLLGARSIDVFAGLTLALAALTSLVAFAALDGLRAAWRIAVAALVALPYMAAAYLAQEAFKEPIVALFTLGFALLLPRVRRPRDAIPLGAIAAGMVYVYSFPGLAWLAGAAVAWGVIELVRGRRPSMAAVWPALAVALAVLVILALPELDRLRDFVDFRALHPDRANEGGLGNLRGQLSPLTALGIWPTSEFRASATSATAPAVVFYAAAVLAAVAFALALPRWVRRHGTAIPAALLAAAVLYLGARAFGTVYTSAKALAIAAPLILLITLGALLLRESSARWPRVLAAIVALAAAFSSFLILRQAPVAPEEHAEELAQIRPLVQGEKLLFLGRDNFIQYELRGSKPFTAVRNFYDPYYVKPNLELENVFAKFDFDSVTGKTLARFPYVLTTKAAYASGPPPGYEESKETENYVLWKREDKSPAGRRPGENDARPGRIGGCSGHPSTVVGFPRPPVVESDWSDPTLEDGQEATMTLDLDPGTWDLSLQYDATRAVTLNDTTVPGNLDYRGSVPFFPAGTIESDGGPVEITATVEKPPLAGRLLGASSVAHLGSLAATATGPRAAAGPACDGYVDWYEER